MAVKGVHYIEMVVGRQVFTLLVGHEGPQGEQRYSSTLYSTSAFQTRVGVSPTPRPPLPPGKTRYPLYRRLRGPQGRPGREVILVPTGIRSPDRSARSQSLYRLSYRPIEMVVFLFNYVIYISLLLCLCIVIVCLCIFIVMYVLYYVSLCCFVYCLCVNVYCTAATGFKLNCS